ncbi:MAG: hypothetical protein DMG40_07820 [Acidobacteria bacterium]|nr:MAG: hypothetical protein DMG40_07820 [Acidobacteriota bacterium]
MNRQKTFSFTFLLAALALASCSGPFKGGSASGGGGGNATLSFTLIADTPPASPSLLAFKVSINGVQIKPASGSALTLTPATPVIDLMRLESDSAFLGSLSKVPAGIYTVQVSLSNPAVSFLNNSSSTITAGSTTCTAGSVCTATLTATGNPTVSSFNLTVAASANQGVELDFNLNSAISLSGGTLSVNFNPSASSPGVFSAFNLPRQNANLGSNQLELLEDFTGVVSLGGSNVTVTSPVRGALTAVESSSSFFDASPDGMMCQTPASFSCAVNGQVASVDGFLNSDGTLALKEYEPLTSTAQDLVEGIVYNVTPGSSTQFSIVVTDKVQAASGSLIGGLSTGDLLTVNLSSSPPVHPFLVDTKGLPVENSFSVSYNLFATQTTTAAIHQGQSVALHVSAFTAASGRTLASATVDTVTLRWSRLIASVTGAASTTQINVNTVPSYFGFTSASIFPTEVFTGTLGADGVTNLDGIGSANSVNPSLPVGLRVLYLENSTNSSQFPFMAAKIRQQ